MPSLTHGAGGGMMGAPGAPKRRSRRKEGGTMRRTIVLARVAAFVMAFLGSLAALALALPAIVGAQEARIRAEQFTVVGDNGADRIRLQTGPGVGAYVRVLDANGGLRTE